MKDKKTRPQYDTSRPIPRQSNLPIAEEDDSDSVSDLDEDEPEDQTENTETSLNRRETRSFLRQLADRANVTLRRFY